MTACGVSLTDFWNMNDFGINNKALVHIQGIY